MFFVVIRERQLVCLLCLFQPGQDAVTRVKLKESIDHIIAVGSSSGDVCIFQLPGGMSGKAQQVNWAWQWSLLQ